MVTDCRNFAEKYMQTHADDLD